MPRVCNYATAKSWAWLAASSFNFWIARDTVDLLTWYFSAMTDIGTFFRCIASISFACSDTRKPAGMDSKNSFSSSV